jgi:dipeptidase E
MAEKRILALSSSRVGNSSYLEKAVPLVKEMLGEKPLRIAFIPFAFVDEDKTPLLKMVNDAFAGLP